MFSPPSHLAKVRTTLYWAIGIILAVFAVTATLSLVSQFLRFNSYR